MWKITLKSGSARRLNKELRLKELGVSPIRKNVLMLDTKIFDVVSTVPEDTAEIVETGNGQYEVILPEQDVVSIFVVCKLVYDNAR